MDDSFVQLHKQTSGLSDDDIKIVKKQMINFAKDDVNTNDFTM
jgi:hypothetical protein